MEQDLLSFDGRRICVTGSTLGIGRAIAGAFARAGGRVVINGPDDNDNGALAEISAWGECHHIAADLATGRGARDLIAGAVARLGGIDTLVCNAGSFFDTAFAELTEDRIDRTFDLNVKGALLCAQGFAAQVAPGHENPSIICTGSTNSLAAEKDSVAYDTSKGAVLMMIRSLAVSLAGRGIRVNGVGPGLIDTPLTAAGLAVAGVRAKVSAQIPLGRIGRPQDVAGAALFLASPLAGYVTGHMIYVDGGILAQQMSWDPTT